MGSGGGGTSTSNTAAQIAPQLQPLFAQTGQTLQNLQPQIANQAYEFFGANPQQIPGQTQGQQNIADVQMARAFTPWETGYDVAGTGIAANLGQLRGPEAYALNQSQGYGALRAPEHAAWDSSSRYGNLQGPEYAALSGSSRYGQLRSPEEQALQQIGYFSGGEIGQSPATKAAMAAVRNPVLNDAALAGLGNSDAVMSGLEGAYAPILAQELAIRSSNIGQLANLGAQQRGGDIAAGNLQAQVGAQQRGGNIAAGNLQAQLGAQQRGGDVQAGNLQAQIAQAMRNGDMNAANYLANMGQNITGRGSALLQQAGQGQEAGRQIEAQQGEANYLDMMRRQGLFSNFTTGILSGFPSVGGSQSTVTTQKGGSTGK